MKTFIKTITLLFVAGFIFFYSALTGKVCLADTVNIFATNDNEVLSQSNSSFSAMYGGYALSPRGGDEFYQGWGKSSGTWYGSRVFFDFDTSGIPAGSTITSAIVYIYGDAKSGSSDRELFSSTSHNPVQASDWAEIGSTALSNSINWTTSAYNTFTLNSSGLANINIGGVSKFVMRDVESDVADTENDYTETDGFFSAKSGTSYDPYISVIFTTGGTPTTTPVNSSCTPDSITDIAKISACSFASSTGIIYTNYNAPAILYLYLYTLVIICMSLVGLFYFIKK